ncbi:MAG: cell envelope integrity EipB family protein [Bdellovibrionales bacterium]
MALMQNLATFLRRHALVICALLAVVGVLVVGLRPAGQSEPSAAETAAAAAAISFTPHRALYDLKLQSIKPNGNINNVQGKMLFAWDDACEGWTIEQRLDMNYEYEGGGSQNSKTSLATWEAKDASMFRFSVRRETNGEATEEFRGQAVLANGGGTAHYTTPKERDVKLPSTTLFPSVHTLELLRKAKAGEHVYTREVFDGADEQGRNFISAFISNPVVIEAPKDAVNAELQQGRAWPVRMAFYAPENQAGTPDYEMTMMLLENGVATSLTIDYGDFVVSATLKNVEPLARTCS